MGGTRTTSNDFQQKQEQGTRIRPRRQGLPFHQELSDEGAKKLSDLRTGPFEVVKKVGDGAYKLKLPAHVKVHPVFNVALLTKWRPDPILGRVQPEPTPVIIDGHEEYVIKKILNSNWLGKHFQYKVTYDSYGKEHDEWLFRDNLLEDLGVESLEDSPIYHRVWLYYQTTCKKL